MKEASEIRLYIRNIRVGLVSDFERYLIIMFIVHNY